MIDWREEIKQNLGGVFPPWPQIWKAVVAGYTANGASVGVVCYGQDSDAAVIAAEGFTNIYPAIRKFSGFVARFQ